MPKVSRKSKVKEPEEPKFYVGEAKAILPINFGYMWKDRLANQGIPVVTPERQPGDKAKNKNDKSTDGEAGASNAGHGDSQSVVVPVSRKTSPEAVCPKCSHPSLKWVRNYFKKFEGQGPYGLLTEICMNIGCMHITGKFRRWYVPDILTKRPPPPYWPNEVLLGKLDDKYEDLVAGYTAALDKQVKEFKDKLPANTDPKDAEKKLRKDFGVGIYPMDDPKFAAYVNDIAENGSPIPRAFDKPFDRDALTCFKDIGDVELMDLLEEVFPQGVPNLVDILGLKMNENSFNKDAAAPPDRIKQRDNLIYKAKLAEKDKRFEDMVKYMKKIAETSESEELSVDERNLLSVAYKNIIGSRRSSWRILASILQKEEGKLSSGPQKWNYVRELKGNVEKELKDVSNEIISLIDKYLLPNAHSDETKVFYYKMRADYYRYMAEFTYDEERKGNAEHSLSNYKTASEIAESALRPEHPIRLGLALNFSVFYFEILNLPDEAIKLARFSFDTAMAELDTLSDEENDTTVILQILRDNLALWTQDSPSTHEAKLKKK